MAVKFKLYVEGKDDLAVICQLATLRNIACKTNDKNLREPVFRVEEYDPNGDAIYGIDALLKNLPTLLKVQDYERLGVVVDADDDISARWNGLAKIFRDAGYASTPLDPVLEGTIIEEADMPRIGVWIWPDNSSIGMLEDFVERMIPPGDLLIEKARQTVAEVLAIDPDRFPKTYSQKAMIHTWLAWQPKPGRPQGMAIRAKYFDAECAAATKFLTWLERLFA